MSCYTVNLSSIILITNKFITPPTVLLLNVSYTRGAPLGPRAHYAGVSRVRRFRPPARRQTIAETPPHTSIPSRRRSNGRGGCRSPVRARYGVFWCILHASGAVQEIFCSGRCNPSLPALRASADAHGSWASATASEKNHNVGGKQFRIAAAVGEGTCHGVTLVAGG